MIGKNLNFDLENVNGHASSKLHFSGIIYYVTKKKSSIYSSIFCQWKTVFLNVGLHMV